MYSSILWATDGSPEADAALDEAVELLAPGGRLVAFHADQLFTGSRVAGEHVVVDERDRRRHIDDQVHRLRDEGVTVERVVESTRSEPAREIAKVADELGVQAIVCGTRGLHGITGVMTGSVAAGVMKRAKVPVVVVPRRVAACHPDVAAI